MAKRRSRGEGSIYKVRGRELWASNITLPDGSRKVQYGKTQKEARDKHQTVLNQLRQGLLAKDDTITVGEFLIRYMEGVGKNTLRPRTQEAYLSLIRVHIIPHIGKIKLANLRADQLQDFYSERVRSGLSKRTVQFMHSVIHKALKQAVKWGTIPRNVSDLVTAPRPDKKAPAFYTAEQIKILLDTVRGHQYYLIYLLLVTGGFREGEVLGIHIEDYDKRARTVNVRHAVLTLKGGLVITEPKTQSSKRAVVLPKSAAVELNSYIDQLNKSQGLIFTTRSGKPISPRNLIRHFKLSIEKAGLPDLSVHGLRHSHASFLLAQGLNPKIVQERLGHASIVLTLTTYSHLIPSLQEQAADKLEDVFTA